MGMRPESRAIGLELTASDYVSTRTTVFAPQLRWGDFMETLAKRATSDSRVAHIADVIALQLPDGDPDSDR